MMDRRHAIVEAVKEMILIPFFPVGKDPQVQLMRVLSRFVDDDPEHIIWLGQAAADKFSSWPGPGAIRELWCSRYRPADGKEPGLSASAHELKEPRSLDVQAAVLHQLFGEVER